MVQNLVLIFNGFVNPVAMDAIEWKYYIMFCCILGVEILICYFTFAETSCRSLEEVGKFLVMELWTCLTLLTKFLWRMEKGDFLLSTLNMFLKKNYMCSLKTF